ncbi:MAG: RNA pseudouridine synthase, partial [Verrucomicrobiota bacterium]
MADKAPFISFPEGYLGSRSAKFPLIADTDEYFAINKEAGLACFQHDWTQGKPDFTAALRRELIGGKPQLARLGIEGVFRIFNLDAEVSGATLYAKTEAAEEKIKNAFGSRQIRMFYHFLATNESGERELASDLPLARHFQERRMLVSHKTGKKCKTQFRFLRNFGQFELWEAETLDMRTHQIRLHAAELGLSIVGEEEYAKGEKILLSGIKRGYRPS